MVKIIYEEQFIRYDISPKYTKVDAAALPIVKVSSLCTHAPSKIIVAI